VAKPKLIRWASFNLFQVEFPEARIYEETLNILLYENRDSRPDTELMLATMNHPDRSFCPSDEELEDKEKNEKGSSLKKK